MKKTYNRIVPAAPKTLTDDQCSALVKELFDNHATQKQQVKADRNAAIAITMLETGVRVAELCGLRIDDLWFADKPVATLVVRKEIAKNKVERYVPISHKLAETILLMHETLWLPKNATTWHFAFFSSNPGIRLTTRTVERIILSAGRKALNVDVTPHMLRHTFGSRLMRKTNARCVQALLGHSSLQSTQIYMHPNSEDLNKAING
jgi:site-specific recombinase XerD